MFSPTCSGRGTGPRSEKRFTAEVLKCGTLVSARASARLERLQADRHSELSER